MAALKAPVLGGSTKEVSLEESVFGAEIKPHLVHETVRAELNAARAGTRGGKNRALVAGGRSKPWRQKGTGRARAGTTRAPQWTGGGMAFPPGMRSFEVKVNRKARRAALRGALSLRRKEGALLAVDALAPSEPKTKQVVELLGRLGLDGSASVLIVVAGADPGLERAARNLPWASVLRAEGLNTYDVLRHKRLLVTRDALDAIHARLGDGPAQEARS